LEDCRNSIKLLGVPLHCKFPGMDNCEANCRAPGLSRKKLYQFASALGLCRPNLR
jgi:hypothetical protein